MWLSNNTCVFWMQCYSASAPRTMDQKLFVWGTDPALQMLATSLACTAEMPDISLSLGRCSILPQCCAQSQSCPALCDPMDCSRPASPVHGSSPGKSTGVVAISFSGGSSQPRNRTQVSCTAGRFFTNWTMREGLLISNIAL